MKVVLLEEVANVGSIGDVAEVSDGYGRNFLIPTGKARLAEASILRDAGFRRSIEKHRIMQEREQAENLAHNLQGATVKIAARVGGQNRLHGQVTAQQVSLAISEQLKMELDRHKIEIDEPIRSLGSFRLPLRIGHGFDVSLNVEVVDVAEEEDPMVAEAQNDNDAVDGDLDVEVNEAEALDALRIEENQVTELEQEELGT
tara:strand:+ start:3662 stop:4264 length:603 start_codon:yes stop_codon:yes gene_type:complete